MCSFRARSSNLRIWHNFTNFDLLLQIWTRVLNGQWENQQINSERDAVWQDGMVWLTATEPATSQIRGQGTRCPCDPVDALSLLDFNWRVRDSGIAKHSPVKFDLCWRARGLGVVVEEFYCWPPIRCSERSPESN